jgi:hypothetical protein
MARSSLFVWEGKEYEHNPKGSDWYWALGIICTSALVASVLFGQFLLGLLIVVAAVTVGVRAAKHPPTHRFEITEQGLIIGSELHDFDQMLSFCVLEDIEGKYPPVLSIKTESLLSPHLVIPLENVNVDAVYSTFLDRVHESEHKHTFADLVGGFLGF